METTTPLTQKQKGEKIAEALKYTRCVGGCQPKGETEPRYWRTPTGREVRVIPDYFNDLNAMREAVAVLPPEKKEAFVYKLYDFTSDSLHDYDGDTNWLTVFQIANMTASERAEAFGRTLNLWQ